MKVQTKSYTLEEAKRNLERYCAYQERCHQEVIQKLKSMGMISEVIDVVTVHLIEHNFLNEERFARNYTRGKFKIKNWGRIRIKSELKKRNIGDRIINLALTEITEEDYLRKLEEISKKKLLGLSEYNKLVRKKKLQNFLVYRGWENDLVYSSINKLLG
ncbi:regulatory protein RecX [Eudoraea chungangensis]|uniref:regulatory protein RecX n=1 Tax=Eudoraea chungangensis TaxID=1481905 RepID=UPI0023EE1C3B|nr:regulatory protein RecX [Eudoraea chungangensis]